jgi:hypothetical protein
MKIFEFLLNFSTQIYNSISNHKNENFKIQQYKKVKLKGVKVSKPS